MASSSCTARSADPPFTSELDVGSQRFGGTKLLNDAQLAEVTADNTLGGDVGTKSTRGETGMLGTTSNSDLWQENKQPEAKRRTGAEASGRKEVLAIPGAARSGAMQDRARLLVGGERCHDQPGLQLESDEHQQGAQNHMETLKATMLKRTPSALAGPSWAVVSFLLLVCIAGVALIFAGAFRMWNPGGVENSESDKLVSVTQPPRQPHPQAPSLGAVASPVSSVLPSQRVNPAPPLPNSPWPLQPSLPPPVTGDSSLHLPSSPQPSAYPSRALPPQVSPPSFPTTTPLSPPLSPPSPRLSSLFNPFFPPPRTPSSPLAPPCSPPISPPLPSLPPPSPPPLQSSPPSSPPSPPPSSPPPSSPPPSSPPP
eukprot:6214719-Pleurochrysis_carterae.AAC.5